MKYIAIFLSILYLTACTKIPTGSQSPDIEGTWSASWESDGVLTYIEMSYLPDKRKCTMFLDIYKNQSKVTYAVGEWRLNGQVLEQWSTKSTNSAIEPNKIDRDLIVSVDDKFLVLKSLIFKDTEKYTRHKVFEERGDIHCRNAS